MESQFDVRRGDDRFHTRLSWLDSRHSFSFGRHYDPRNTHFGLLLVSNDDLVQPDTGFETHPHRDMEIVTWVLEGSLVHQDSAGHSGIIYPGLAQRMSAGSGVMHSEKNAAAAGDDMGPVRFVQMWVLPDEQGIPPEYAQLDVNAQLDSGNLIPVASGRSQHEAAISLHQRDAAFYVARLSKGDSVILPAAPYVHLYVARESVDVEGAERLSEQDALRITASQGQRVTAVENAEILVWEMHAKAVG